MIRRALYVYPVGDGRNPTVTMVGLVTMMAVGLAVGNEAAENMNGEYKVTGSLSLSVSVSVSVSEGSRRCCSLFSLFR